MPPAAAALFIGENRPPAMVGRERLELLEADVLVLDVYGGDAGAVPADPVFATLEVARRGRMIMLPEVIRAKAAMTFGSVLSLPTALAEMVRAWPPHWTATRPRW